MKTRTAPGILAVSWLFPFALASALACSKTEEPKADPPTSATSAAPMTASAAPSAMSATPSASSAAPKPRELAWDVPARWKEAPAPPNSFRKASYTIPRAAGDSEDGELSVITAGGSMDDNIARWQRQFHGAEAKRTPQKVGDIQVTVVELHGPYQGMGQAGGSTPAAHDTWAMLAAIADIDGSTGQSHYFFKLTGPEKTVLAARPDFDKFVSSLRGR